LAGDQVLMTVEFPSNFMVADPREFKKGILNHGSSGARFAWTRSRCSRCHGCCRNQGSRSPGGESGAHNFIRFVHNGGGLGGQVLLQQLGAWSGMAAVEKELAFR